jgi:hypothetical protein
MFYRCEWHESGTKLTLAKYFALGGLVGVTCA